MPSGMAEMALDEDSLAVFVECAVTEILTGTRIKVDDRVIT